MITAEYVRGADLPGIENVIKDIEVQILSAKSLGYTGTKFELKPYLEKYLRQILDTLKDAGFYASSNVAGSDPYRIININW